MENVLPSKPRFPMHLWMKNGNVTTIEIYYASCIGNNESFELNLVDKLERFPLMLLENDSYTAHSKIGQWATQILKL